MSVPARVSLVTLGVRDVARATAFYDALGWERSDAGGDEISFFRTAGAILALFGRAALAEDARLDGDGGGDAAEFRGVALAINVENETAVDAALEAAATAGATILKPAHRAFWGGYSGYFADPDGHAWEVAYVPGFPLGDDGLPRLP